MEIKSVLKENNFRFSKAYGQNFLTDTDLLAQIAEDGGVDSDSEVLEIGPGAGTLTEQLCLRAKKVLAYEIDKSLEPVLKKNLPYRNAEIIFKDVMKTDLNEIEGKLSGGYKVVANIPYYITTPIIIKFLTSNASSVTVTVQIEVAERLCASKGTSSYGAVSVAVSLYGNARITRIIPAEKFYPVPKVDSAVVRIDLVKNKYSCDYENVRKTVKAAFAMRRKTLVNNITAAFGFNREKAEKILADCGFNLKIRGEELSVEEFIKLSERLFQQGN